MMLMKVSMERCCEGLTVKGRKKQGGVQRRGKVFVGHLNETIGLTVGAGHKKSTAFPLSYT